MAQLVSSDALQVVKDADFSEMLEAIRCGELTSLACLCDKSVRDAHTAISERFNTRQQAVIYKALCGCAVQSVTTPTSTAVTPAVAITPASTPVTPVSPAPAASAPAPTPVSKCDPALQPPNFYTGFMG